VSLFGALSQALTRNRLKILYQVQYVALARGAAQGGQEKYLGMMDSFKKIFQEEGVKGFFRGNGANCVRCVQFLGLHHVHGRCPLSTSLP
jgi:hypothetical protein